MKRQKKKEENKTNWKKIIQISFNKWAAIKHIIHMNINIKSAY